MKHILPSLRMFVFMTILTGLVYPLLVTALGQLFFPAQAKGSLVKKDGQVVGSWLVGQSFRNPRYFWPRPSAVGYNPLPSGGSNFGPTSRELQMQVTQRESRLKMADPGSASPPQNLLFASGSGLDPDVSLRAAFYQVPRIARARGMEAAQISALIRRFARMRQFGFLGEPRVNVLRLNLALDKAQGGAR